MLTKGNLYIISAPSGTGKTTLVRELVKSMPGIVVSVSHTTRLIRPQEKEGVDYHFVSKDEFNNMLKQKAFLEHAEVYNNLYGTARLWVEEARLRGLDVILEIDWQGARQVRELLVEAQSIFILPPSREALYERLRKRLQDSDDIIKTRMAEATEQISHYMEFDYLICNDQFEEALADLKAIVRAHRLHGRRQRAQLSLLLDEIVA